MGLITHEHALRGWIAGIAGAAALVLAVAPGTAGAQVLPLPVGHAAVMGTMSYVVGTACATFHEDASAVGVVDDPGAGTYTGTMKVTADLSSFLCSGPLTLDSGTFTESVSGSNGGNSIACRPYGAPPGSTEPMPGVWFRFGEILLLGGGGVCSINGVDTWNEQVYQTLVFAPTGVSAAPLQYTTGAVAGDLRIGY